MKIGIKQLRFVYEFFYLYFSDLRTVQPFFEIFLCIAIICCYLLKKFVFVSLLQNLLYLSFSSLNCSSFCKIVSIQLDFVSSCNFIINRSSLSFVCSPFVVFVIALFLSFAVFKYFSISFYVISQQPSLFFCCGSPSVYSPYHQHSFNFLYYLCLVRFSLAICLPFYFFPFSVFVFSVFGLQQVILTSLLLLPDTFINH